MTAQMPERIIIDGRPHALYADPLYRLLASRRMDFRDPNTYNSACWRQYLGTWEIRNRALYLIQFNKVARGEELLTSLQRQRLFRAVPCTSFPIRAHWFNGTLRIPLGRRLVYSHHGWSHWFERERVITFAAGNVTRDREVNTQAILERQLKRNQQMRAVLDGSAILEEPGPLVWFDNSDDEDWTANWWPPDYSPPAA